MATSAAAAGSSASACKLAVPNRNWHLGEIPDSIDAFPNEFPSHRQLTSPPAHAWSNYLTFNQSPLIDCLPFHHRCAIIVDCDAKLALI
jgi:hypothetical protein